MEARGTRGTAWACGGYNVVVEIRTTTSRDLHLAPPRPNEPASQPANQPTDRPSDPECFYSRARFMTSYELPCRRLSRFAGPPRREKRSIHRRFFRYETTDRPLCDRSTLPILIFVSPPALVVCYMHL